MKCSQTHAILVHLKRGRILTPLDALWKFGCNRLAARIHELRRSGHEIKSCMIQVGDKRVAAYWLA